MTALKSRFDGLLRSVALILLALAANLFASPFDHIANEIDRADRTMINHDLPDVSDVTPTDIAGAFSLPVLGNITPDMIRTAGAPRPYRSGVHQGVDFYGLPYREPVYPIAAGIIVRLDVDYEPLTSGRRAKMLERCRALGATPGAYGVPFDPEYGDILDALRGRQVWLYHGRNADGEPVLSVYAHLDSVGALSAHQIVTRDAVIGYIGNTGTSYEGRSQTREIHLHLEIYVGERYWRVRNEHEIGVKANAQREAELRRLTLAAFAKRSVD